ncbi:MAG: isocitrate/isopropylmalate dehydrogenase family protein [Candidatus Methanomethylicia archaeon]
MYKIAVMKGDGVGPEVINAAITIIEAVEDLLQINIEKIPVEGGDNAFKKYGILLPEDAVETIKSTHACLKGPIGEPVVDVKLKQTLNLYINLRLAKSYPNTPCLRSNIDLLIVRENTEDLYKGFEFVTGNIAVGLRVISREASRRIAEAAFRQALTRRRKVTAVHKANILKITCGLFAETCREVSKIYPNVIYEEQHVDTCTMNLIRNPESFDVIVTTNMFGDILSSEAAQITGGLGLSPSANIGDSYAIFEPMHGAFFDIAGKDIVNPIAAILSTSMMFKWFYDKFKDLKCLNASNIISRAVEDVLAKGKTLTPDLGGSSSTSQLSHAVTGRIKELVEYDYNPF